VLYREKTPMEYLNSELDLHQGDVVQVTLDSQANVMLMDYSNYDAYRNGRAYRYFGGHATKSPVRIPAPRSGKWYLVVDLGGYAGKVRAGVSVLRETVTAR
jgi:hypothetical protein